MDFTVTNEFFFIYSELFLDPLIVKPLNWTHVTDTTGKKQTENAQKGNVHILWIRYYFVLALPLCEILLCICIIDSNAIKKVSAFTLN